ncbi:hypothetical protein TNCV_4841181 [Trichonephila clavipes]|uniref:Transposase IS30-like HTH domain-containing protein n=1 Tax=Trichonephila clavipes TaxID=2585209 RepID=A0A8X6WJN4_TRICX|nr:hypothetical protein TNCV_4841181 [Trichonephila clavipes]
MAAPVNCFRISETGGMSATKQAPNLFSCGFFKKRSVMSRKKQRSAFNHVFEFDRGRIVAYRDCGLSFREIGSRVERNQTTNADM